MMGRIGPGDEPAPIMADEMKPRRAGECAREAVDVGEELVDGIIGDLARPRAAR